MTKNQATMKKLWLSQAQAAIAQNQSLNEFVLKCAINNRPAAIAAYKEARKMQGGVGNPGGSPRHYSKFQIDAEGFILHRDDFPDDSS